MIDEDKRMASQVWSMYKNKNLDANLKALNINKNTEAHKNLVKNYVHILER